VKTAGIVGGIGPESTVDYYRFLVAEYRARADGSYPAVLIDSIDLTRLLELVALGEHDTLVEWLAEEVGRLQRGGADFAILASNTPHVVFDELSQRAPLPMLSIVEATAAEARRLELRRVGLLGTRFTMHGAFYPQTFGRHEIEVVAPAPDDLAYVHEKYLGELVAGVVLPETRAGLLAVVRRMRERLAIDGVVLAGTELPLVLRDVPDQGIPFLDTAQIHVRRVVDEMLG
jgi:aspartate racemase